MLSSAEPLQSAPLLPGSLCIATGLVNESGLRYNGKQCVVTKLLESEKKANVRFLEDDKEFVLKFERLSPSQANCLYPESSAYSKFVKELIPLFNEIGLFDSVHLFGFYRLKV